MNKQSVYLIGILDMAIIGFVVPFPDYIVNSVGQWSLLWLAALIFAIFHCLYSLFAFDFCRAFASILFSIALMMYLPAAVHGYYTSVMAIIFGFFWSISCGILLLLIPKYLND